jgi:endonuclease-3
MNHSGEDAAFFDKTLRVRQLLLDRYGSHSWSPWGDPVDILIATILSQHTSDVNSARAFVSLKARFPSWDALPAAPVSEIAAAIRVGGLANVKAPRIQAVVEELFTRFPDGDLAPLAYLSVDEARRTLCSLPGVGPKTASCVLLFSLGLPAMPVDTHVHRVARRVGLIPPTMSAGAAHGILESRLGARVDDAYTFHLNMIQHGREVCLARSPRCSICPLSALCDFYVALRSKE